MTAYSFSHEAMNSPFELHIAGQDEDYARQAADALFREVDHIESSLSRFIEYSDVARIKLLEQGQSVKVSAETMECLLVAFWAYRETGGAFDVTLGQGMDKLALDPETLDVGAGISGVEVDLGGIGKGYALDNTAEFIAGWGIGDLLLTAGPSTALALGMNSGEPWSVGLNGKPQVLRDRAISSSGKDVQGEHVVDPRTGSPAAGHEKAWAICPSAAAADALSTAFMVMDTADVEQFCREHDGIEGYVIRGDGEFVSFYRSPKEKGS